MKYIKTYENKRPDGKYWLLPTDGRTYMAFRDIKLPYKFRSGLDANFSVDDDNPKFVYISFNFKNKEWSFIKMYENPLSPDNCNCEEFDKLNYTFKGPIRLNEDDYLTTKYNL
jgi:hypothetical protein